MEYRQLGRSGLTVSEIGFGAWGIGGGWGETADDESLEALSHAIDLGVTFIDTAWGYGNGRSEKLVGQVVRDRTEQVVVATKAPPKNMQWPANHDTPVADAFPAGYLRQRTEESLEHLGLDSVDVQQIHVYAPRWLTEGRWLDEARALKDEGLIRAFGISINDHEPETALDIVRSGAIDTVQVIYNVFDQSPADALLPACQENGVGVIVRVALDEGGLTGTITADTTFGEDDWRHRYFRDDRPAQVEQHVQAIVDDLGIDTTQVPETALRFVLSHPAVSSVIPGMRRARNVERNVAISDGAGLPTEQLQMLAQHRWVRNFYA